MFNCFNTALKVIKTWDKNWVHCNFETKSSQVLNFRSRSTISNIIFMINKLDLLWLLNFVALGIHFIFETKFSWNEGIDTGFNVRCVLLGRNFDFLGGYLVVTAYCLVVTVGYCSLPGDYCSFPILVWMHWLFFHWSLKKYHNRDS